jgi:hypothetical protein
MRLVMAMSAMALLVSGCAGVRKVDLDAWAGVPVEALDTHSFFVTLPVARSVSASGVEIRNYVNSREFASCVSRSLPSGSKFVPPSAVTNCSAGTAACNNIFYIRDGVVLEYAPTGQCRTNETVQPEARYLRLRAQ